VTQLSIAILFKDDVGFEYDLTQPNAIPFNKLQLGESKKVKVIVKNQDLGRNLKDVVVTPVAHPTEQLGTAEDTYEVCDLSTVETGPFTSPLNIGTMGPSAEQDMYIRWTIAPEALPGYGFFALKATGEYDL